MLFHVILASYGQSYYASHLLFHEILPSLPNNYLQFEPKSAPPCIESQPQIVIIMQKRGEGCTLCNLQMAFWTIEMIEIYWLNLGN